MKIVMKGLGSAFLVLILGFNVLSCGGGAGVASAPSNGDDFQFSPNSVDVTEEDIGANVFTGDLLPVFMGVFMGIDGVNDLVDNIIDELGVKGGSTPTVTLFDFSELTAPHRNQIAQAYWITELVGSFQYAYGLSNTTYPLWIGSHDLSMDDVTFLFKMEVSGVRTAARISMDRTKYETFDNTDDDSTWEHEEEENLSASVLVFFEINGVAGSVESTFTVDSEKEWISVGGVKDEETEDMTITGSFEVFDKAGNPILDRAFTPAEIETLIDLLDSLT
ncbi:MAG: hypothetical protein FWH12_09145 [Treponema sp.]|nr:hypothetical protein [Treponema sp.]